MAVLASAGTGTSGEGAVVKYSVPEGNTDAIALKPGDTIELVNGGSYANVRTIVAESNCTIGGKDANGAPAHIKIPSPPKHNVNGVVVSTGVENARVQAIAVECLGAKSTAAVDAGRSKNTHVYNVAQSGCGWALRADRATGLVADLIFSGQLASEYCMGAFGGQDAQGIPYYNENCTIIRFDLVAGMGVKGMSDHGAMHVVRWEHGINTTFGSPDPAVRLPAIANLPGPDGRGFAARVVQASDYDGCTFAVNDGSGLKAYRILNFGKVALGPVPVDLAAHPNRVNKDALLDGWELNGLLVCNKGVVNLTVKNSILRAVKKVNRAYDLHHLQGSAIQLDPSTTGTFDGVTFVQLAMPEFPPGWKHTNCKWSSNADGSNARALP